MTLPNFQPIPRPPRTDDPREVQRWRQRAYVEFQKTAQALFQSASDMVTLNTRNLTTSQPGITSIDTVTGGAPLASWGSWDESLSASRSIHLPPGCDALKLDIMSNLTLSIGGGSGDVHLDGRAHLSDGVGHDVYSSVVAGDTWTYTQTGSHQKTAVSNFTGLSAIWPSGGSLTFKVQGMLAGTLDPHSVVTVSQILGYLQLLESTLGSYMFP